MMETWTDEDNKPLDCGSGYPSDPKCKAWMDSALQDAVFGFPDVVRFSWAPIKARLNNENHQDDGDDEKKVVGAVKPVSVVFAADLDEDEMEQRKSQKGMSAFLAKNAGNSGGGSNKRKQSSYFQSRKLRVVSAF